MDRLIREAKERGEWDDTSFQGRPLPRHEDEAYAGDMALANHLLRNAGAAPPWIEADKRVRALLDERDRIRERARVASAEARQADARRMAELVEQVNRAIEALNNAAPTPRQQRRPLELARELAALATAAPDDGTI